MTIRRLPSDFVVSERPSASFLRSLRAGRSAEAVHAVYELRKESLGTPEAVGLLGKALGVGGGRVDYAGLKDKHARTTQLVSVERPQGEIRTEVLEPRFSARLIGWSNAPVRAECIDGNRFEIVVRDLSPDAAREMDRRASLLRDPSELDSTVRLLVVNYFGAQRFGSARHGGGFVAARLIRGDFEGALKLAIGTPARKDTGKMRAFTRACASRWGEWRALSTELPRCPERRAIETLAAGGSFAKAFESLPHFTQQMSVEAYQSHLWNAAARLLAERIVTEAGERAVAPLVAPQSGDGVTAHRVKPPAALRADDDFGLMLFPPASTVGEAWRNMRMPLLGPSTALLEPWARAVSAVLSEEGIAAENLRIPGMRRPFFGEAERPLFALAEKFEMTPAARDDLAGGKRVKRKVRFELGRGSYATVVLRALGQ
jgi:tRNA pseudouridine13 synthase